MHHLSFTSADTEAQGSQHRFDTDHTGEGIKDKFLELFHKWGLDKEEFLVDFDSTPIITRNSRAHTHACGHILQ